MNGASSTELLMPLENKAAAAISYYTPAQEPPAGAALKLSEKTPSLFQPLKLRGLTLPNRIMLSPMCQYSAQDGHQTDWHFAHLGSLLTRGPGLTMVEATAVEPRGRTTPEDCGLWTDSQAEPLKRLTEFAHSQGQKIGIQLGHAGRKASMVAPWLAFPPALSPPAAGGWGDNVIGPSAIPWSDRHAPVRSMDHADLDTVRKAFSASAKRAVAAGFDTIEIHAAHGYLLHSFCSPVSNARTDEFGGSFENRTRLLRLVVADVRKAMPDVMPLLVRISGSDGLEETELAARSWTLEEAVRLTPELVDLGVDLIDVSYGGTHIRQKQLQGNANLAELAHTIKKSVGDRAAVATVGMIRDSSVAQDQLDRGLDMVAVGRGFLHQPNLVRQWAKESNVDIAQAHQIGWCT